jgi:hypothetical protein
MTRRKFLHRLIQTGLLGLSGLGWLVTRAIGTRAIGKHIAPRRFVRAIRMKNYPGSVGHLSKINKNAKWSG